MDFSSSIKKIRKDCLMSQTDFAENIGVSYSTVNRWENRKAVPNFKTLQKIDSFVKLQGLDVDIRDSLEDIND